MSGCVHHGIRSGMRPSSEHVTLDNGAISTKTRRLLMRRRRVTTARSLHVVAPCGHGRGPVCCSLSDSACTVWWLRAD